MSYQTKITMYLVSPSHPQQTVIAATIVTIPDQTPSIRECI